MTHAHDQKVVGSNIMNVAASSTQWQVGHQSGIYIAENKKNGQWKEEKLVATAS